MDRSVAVRLTLEIAQYKAGLSDASAATDRFASQAESAGKRVQKSEQSKGEAATSSAKTTTQAATTAGTAQESAASTAESAAGRTEQASQTTAQAATSSADATVSAASSQEEASRRVAGANEDSAASAEAAGESAESAGARSQAAADGTAQAAQSSASAQESASKTAQAASEKQASTAESSAKRSEGAFSRIAQAAQENREAWTTAGTALTAFGAAVTGIGVAALTTGISYNQLQQTSRAALTTLMRSAKDANAQMDKLDEFASTSPFAKDVFIRAQQQMLGFGIEAQKVIPYLDAIQNAVAATGGSNQDIAELSRIFSQISASAKITGQDLQEFGNRGIDAATIIGSQMGMTGAEIREAITSGSLDAGTALDALAAGMQDRFGGAADNVKNTLSGAFDRVKAAWRDLSAELAAPLVGPEGGGLLIGLLNQTADLMRAFQELPGPVKTVAAVIGGLTGTAALAAGSFLLLAPRIVETQAAFRTLAQTMPRVTNMVGRVGRIAQGAFIGFASWKILTEVNQWMDSTVTSAGDLENALVTLGDVEDPIQAIFGDGNRGMMDGSTGLALDTYFSDIEGFQKALDDLTNADFWNKLERNMGRLQDGLGGGGMYAAQRDQIKELDTALSNLATNSMEDATQAFDRLWGAMDYDEGRGAQLLEVLPEFREHLVAVATEMGITASDANLLRIATGELAAETGDAEAAAAEMAAEQGRLADVTRKTTGEIADQVGELQTLLDVMMDIGGQFLSVQDAQARFGEELAGLTDAMVEFETLSGNALDETGENWDFFSDKGRFASDTVNGLAEAGRTLVSSLDEANASTEELEAAMQRTRDEVVNAAMGFGMGEEEANALADAMGLIPENVSTNIDVETELGLSRLAALEEQMEMLPDGEVTVNGDTLPAEDALAEIVETINTTDADHIVINGNIVPVEDALDEIEGLIEDGVSDLDVGINRDGAILETTELVSDIEGMAPEIPLLADDTSARETGTTFGTWVENLDPLANIDAESSAAESQTMWWQDWTNRTTGTAGIDAEDRGADSQLARTLRTIDKATGTTGIDAEDRGAESETRRITRMITGKAGTMGVLAEDRGATGEGRRLARLIDGYGASVNVGASARWGQINSVIAAIQNRAGSAGASVVIGGVMGRASGGEVWGSGTATSDSIPAMLSNGEFVVRTAAADHYGRGLLHAINSLSLPKAAMFADGGPVGPTGWGRGGGYVPPPVQSGSTSVVNNYHLQINPGDLQGIRTLEELVANARRTSRQQVGVRG